MDSGALGVLVPIVAIVVWGAVKVASVVSRGWVAGLNPEDAARINALASEVEAVRRDLSEAQERLDFTERRLSQQRSDRLAPPR